MVKIVNFMSCVFLSQFLKLDFLPWLVWLSWLECHLTDWRVVASIPSQGLYPGCGFDAQSRCVWEATNQCFFLSLPSSLSKGNEKKGLQVRQKLDFKITFLSVRMMYSVFHLRVQAFLSFTPCLVSFHLLPYEAESVSRSRDFLLKDQREVGRWIRQQGALGEKNEIDSQGFLKREERSWCGKIRSTTNLYGAFSWIRKRGPSEWIKPTCSVAGTFVWRHGAPSCNK